MYSKPTTALFSMDGTRRAIDKEEGTVIMIQIENEIGMLEDARDYSKEANALFNGTGAR